MKLNFVLSYTNKDGKHWALHCQIDSNYNLLRAFEPFYNVYNDKHLGELTIIQYVPSKKKAIELTNQWNEDYKRNGTLNNNW